MPSFKPAPRAGSPWNSKQVREYAGCRDAVILWSRTVFEIYWFFSSVSSNCIFFSLIVSISRYWPRVPPTPGSHYPPAPLPPRTNRTTLVYQNTLKWAKWLNEQRQIFKLLSPHLPNIYSLCCCGDMVWSIVPLENSWLCGRTGPADTQYRWEGVARRRGGAAPAAVLAAPPPRTVVQCCSRFLRTFCHLTVGRRKLLVTLHQALKWITSNVALLAPAQLHQEVLYGGI